MYNGALRTALIQIRKLNENNDQAAIEKYIKKVMRKLAEQQCV
jgi:hypothetical protein